jgi:predicted flap endonuclease-1-like 5' DNA nuclease/multisubunit Na+/H+ antiporter MnhG subunit
VKGWEGVTRDLATNDEERGAWKVLTYGFVLVVFATGLVTLFLSKSDIPVVAKALMSALALLGVLVLISGVYSTLIDRAEARKQADREGNRASSAASVAAAVAPSPSAPEPAPARVIPEPTPDTEVSEEPLEPTPVPDPAPVAAAVEPEPVAEVAPASEPEPEAGTRPQALDAPRQGEGDDLTLIKGIGPALKTLCNRLGFWHFDQIAAWTDNEVAWVDQNLEGFKGRVSRDEWVAQAKILAAGGQTEFSERQGNS